MGANTCGKTFKDADSALAMVVKLALAGQWFQVQPLPDGSCKISVRPENQHLLRRTLKPAYALIQEGGTRFELYLHAHGSAREAAQDRVDCAEDGAYRTSPVVEVPPVLAELGEHFYATAEQLVRAGSELDYGD